jgi:hypothetical protein
VEKEKKQKSGRVSGTDLPVQSPFQQLVRTSSMIFTGTVVERGTSSVPDVQPSDRLVVVRLDRGLRIDPVLGDLHGKMITVAATAPESLSPGQKAVFFTNSWVHGRGIAVREVEHVDINKEGDVAAALAQLPDLYLFERLQKAELIVDAEVAHISEVEKRGPERKAALWAGAELRVHKVLRGQGRARTVVYFPTADWPPWTKAPRFKEGQRGIFILHAPSRNATLSEARLEAGSLVALDPADFQPESQLPLVQKLLAGIE